MHTITLLFRRLFYSSNGDIPLITSPLSQIWVYQIIVLRILLGNRIYDSIAQNSPQTFGVLQALQVSIALNSIIGHTTVDPQLPVSIIWLSYILNHFSALFLEQFFQLRYVSTGDKLYCKEERLLFLFSVPTPLYLFQLPKEFFF